eukprot:scaffold6349_cov115-Isochrysis_galbana.AAC.6
MPNVMPCHYSVPCRVVDTGRFAQKEQAAVGRGRSHACGPAPDTRHASCIMQSLGFQGDALWRLIEHED